MRRLQALIPGRHFPVIGFAAGDIPKMPLNLALLKGCDIAVCSGAHGPTIRRRTAPILRSRQGTAEGKISSHVDRTFPLAQTAEALRARRPQGDGKVICIREDVDSAAVVPASRRMTAVFVCDRYQLLFDSAIDPASAARGFTVFSVMACNHAERGRNIAASSVKPRIGSMSATNGRMK